MKESIIPEENFTDEQHRAYRRFDERLVEVLHTFGELRDECELLSEECLLDADIVDAILNELAGLDQDLRAFTTEFMTYGLDEDEEQDEPQAADRARPAGPVARPAEGGATVNQRPAVLSLKERLQRLRHSLQRRKGGGGPSGGPDPASDP